MIKKYYKIKPILAEQFDGSNKMVQKYGLTGIGTPVESNIPSDVWAIQTREGMMQFEVGAWIATGIDGEHWVIADDIFKKTYVEADK